MKHLVKHVKKIRRISRDLRKIDDPTERFVARRLMKALPGSEYAVINNVLLHHADGRPTQIDHIVVSTHGIFCIETKSHKGLILANRMRRMFKQYLRKNNFDIKPNPVNQNYGHIVALRDLLGDKVKAPIVNIVVFPSAGKLVIQGYEHVENLDHALMDISSEQADVYTPREAETIIGAICSAAHRDGATKRKHIAYVRARYSRA